MKRKNRIGLTLFFILITTVSCSTKYRDIQSFETVWQTVNEKHYDPTFGGINWKALYDHYKPKIADAKTGSAFYTLTNQMLFELKLSHLLVAAEIDLKRYMPILFAEGSIGIDIRWMDGNAVITRMNTGSPAAAAGLRPGYIIEQVDRKAIKQIESNADEWMLPPFNQRNRRNNLSNYILGHIYGPPNTMVTITYRDELDDLKEIAIIRKSRGRGKIMSPAMPPAFIEFEAKQLDNGVGYIRFNHFAEPVDTRMIAALGTMHNAPGIIIDLRGNTGGYFSVLDIIAKHLLTEKLLLYRFKFRDRTVDKVLAPVAGAYRKPVVVLIDGKSMSCSELFASSMQAVKRVVLVGDHSPGYLLGANWLKLMNGGAFMHTFLQPLPADGKIVENNGVKPDISVSLDREVLLDGRDTQLEAAIKIIVKVLK